MQQVLGLKQLPPIKIGKLHFVIKQFASEALLQLLRVILRTEFNAFPASCCFLASLWFVISGCNIRAASHWYSWHFYPNSCQGQGIQLPACCRDASGLSRAHPSFPRNKQRWQPGQWLWGGDIQSCSADNTALQCCQQRLLVNYCTWCGIRVSECTLQVRREGKGRNLCHA